MQVRDVSLRFSIGSWKFISTQVKRALTLIEGVKITIDYTMCAVHNLGLMEAWESTYYSLLCHGLRRLGRLRPCM